MDKRSFNFMFTVVVASMVIIGTYKITKKKNPSRIASVISKTNK